MSDLKVSIRFVPDPVQDTAEFGACRMGPIKVLIKELMPLIQCSATHRWAALA